MVRGAEHDVQRPDDATLGLVSTEQFAGIDLDGLVALDRSFPCSAITCLDLDQLIQRPPGKTHENAHEVAKADSLRFATAAHCSPPHVRG